MTNPERRRPSHELQAEADAYFERAEEIFERVRKRLEERRVRRERRFLSRLFRRA
jgi:hypothetical protein